MNTQKRLYAVVAVYLLSLPALLLTLVYWVESFRDKNPASWISLVFWPLAWGLHFAMSVSWAGNNQLPKITVLIGAFCGALSLLALPLSALASPDRGAFSSPILPGIFMFQLVLLSPAMVLVFATSKFHWFASPSGEEVPQLNA